VLPELIGLWDAFRLERVLDNLLGNAVKYSPHGGAISVRVSQERGDAVLEVVDQGLGIPAAALPHLFEHFQRAGNVGTTQGTGLGLVGVRRIVEEHGGTIDIRSQEGQGTTVTIHLPRVPADAPAPLHRAPGDSS
jgi:signal transduction histidine kinase